MSDRQSYREMLGICDVVHFSVTGKDDALLDDLTQELVDKLVSWVREKKAQGTPAKYDYHVIQLCETVIAEWEASGDA